jgi:dihydroxy-acid dehydratase
VLVDLKPTGEHYLQDLHEAGGLTSVLWELRGLLHHDCLTVTGRDPGRAAARRTRLRGHARRAPS